MRHEVNCLQLAYGALFCAFVLLSLSAGLTSGQDTNKPTDLRALARQYEQAGDRAKAAETYEQIITGDPAQSVVLASRIAKIYAEAGQTNKAVEWATVVMKKNPDPQAYLAGIRVLLGDYAEARRILAEEIGREKSARRGMILRWQLAGVCEKAGDEKDAEKLLKEAVEISKGQPEEEAAKKRLSMFAQVHTNSVKKAE